MLASPGDLMWSAALRSIKVFYFKENSTSCLIGSFVKLGHNTFIPSFGKRWVVNYKVKWT